MMTTTTTTTTYQADRLIAEAVMRPDGKIYSVHSLQIYGPTSICRTNIKLTLMRRLGILALSPKYPPTHKNNISCLCAVLGLGLIAKKVFISK